MLMKHSIHLLDWLLFSYLDRKKELGFTAISALFSRNVYLIHLHIRPLHPTHWVRNTMTLTFSIPNNKLICYILTVRNAEKRFFLSIDMANGRSVLCTHFLGAFASIFKRYMNQIGIPL